MKRETAYGLLVVSLLAFVLSFTVTWIKKAHGAAACLTKKEARQLWPRQHIYWYSSDHCWSNRRGGAPRNLRYDLIRENHAESLPATPKRAAPPIKIVATQDYNELDAQADTDLFFNAKPVPFWRFSALDDGFNTWRRRVEDLLK